MVNSKQDKFNFFVPMSFMKGGDDYDPDKIWIEGICSSIDEDSDGEQLDPMGFEFDPLLRKGFFNWDHQAKKTSAAIVGEPTEAKVVDAGRNFYIKGYLYGAHEEAQSIQRLSEILEKSSTTRRLGFSIEGQVLEKDPMNPKRIKRARITGCAITPCPKNPNTLMSLIKGEYTEAFQEPDSEEENDGQVNTLECPKCHKDNLTSGTCSSCGYSEKAMAVDIRLNPESVEHKVKPTVGLCLTKSEVYDLITSKYTKDVDEAKNIFSFIKSVNSKLFNMQDQNISKEALEKAFSFLDDAIVKSENTEETTEDKEKVEKGEESNAPEEKDEDKDKDDNSEDDEDEQFDKAASMAIDLQKSGKTSDEMCSEMEKAGIRTDIAKAVCDACISDANKNKQGGNVTTSTIQKSETTEEQPGALLQEGSFEGFNKSFDELTDLVKGLDQTLGKKFGAVGLITKSILEQNEFMKGKIDELEGKIDKIANTSQGPKSARTAQAVERFNKSENDGDGREQRLEGFTVYNLNKSEDVKELANVMVEECGRLRNEGKINQELEGAAAMLEVTKSLSRSMLPTLRAMKIQVISE